MWVRMMSSFISFQTMEKSTILHFDRQRIARKNKKSAAQISSQSLASSPRPNACSSVLLEPFCDSLSRHTMELFPPTYPSLIAALRTDNLPTALERFWLALEGWKVFGQQNLDFSRVCVLFIASNLFFLLWVFSLLQFGLINLQVLVRLVVSCSLLSMDC